MSAVVATSRSFFACGSKVFYVLLLPIFLPAREKSATENSGYRMVNSGSGSSASVATV
jgi:hypothetical protein